MKLLNILMARRNAGTRWQRGFTMVELAIVLVVAGLILVAVLKGTDTINKAKSERAVADLRGLQGLLLEYQKRTGHLPGDCDNNGRINFAPEPTAYPATPLVWDSIEGNRILPTTAIGTGPTANCAASTTVETEPNIVWNDLRRNNIVDPQRLPAELAKNVNGSYYAVGNMSAGLTATDNANVIVVYSIPVWMAEAIDASVDGAVSYTGTAAVVAEASANTGRIRRWDGNVTRTAAGDNSTVFTTPATASFINGYAKAGETRDSVISISFQFDTNKLPN